MKLAVAGRNGKQVRRFGEIATPQRILWPTLGEAPPVHKLQLFLDPMGVKLNERESRLGHVSRTVVANYREKTGEVERGRL